MQRLATTLPSSANITTRRSVPNASPLRVYAQLWSQRSLCDVGCTVIRPQLVSTAHWPSKYNTLIHVSACARFSSYIESNGSWRRNRTSQRNTLRASKDDSAPSPAPTQVSSNSADSAQTREPSNTGRSDREDSLEWLVEGELWSVRHILSSELSAATSIQAVSFTDYSYSFAALDNFLLKLFKAELLDALNRKLSYGSAGLHRFVCLVAQRTPDIDDEGAGLEPVVGVVEASVQKSKEVLDVIGGKEYFYVYSMAVDPEHRRKAVATSLLQGAEEVARKEGFTQLVLNVADVNDGARACYESCGYQVVSTETISKWAALFTKDRKCLMVKDISVE